MALTHPSRQQTTVHEKKRHGQHRKSSKHYSKTYWPYLPMVLLIGVGFVINIFLNSPRSVLNYATSVSAAALLQDTNAHRIQNNVGALALNNQLSQAAQVKANDMAARNYWEHATPEGKQPWQFMRDQGYRYVLAGENLAYGFDTSTATVAGWINSTSHRENLLKAGYRDVGFGIANAPNFQGHGPQTIIVAMYAAPQTVAVPAKLKPVVKRPATVNPPPPVRTAEPSEIQPAPTTPVPATTAPTAPAPPPAQEAPSKVVATNKEAAPPVSEPETHQLQSREVSRLDVLANGNGQWATLVLSVLATIGAISLVYRHGKLWKRYLLRGERFAIRHPLFDIYVVAAVVVMVLLSQTSGTIH